MTWLRRNRVWLAVLPLALALMFAASSSRLKRWWWDNELHAPMDTASAGSWATWHDEVDKYDGAHEVRDFEVRVTSIDTVRAAPMEYGDPVPVPKGSTGLQPRLEFRSVSGDIDACDVWLVAEDGTRYGDAEIDALGQYDPCLPVDGDWDEIGPRWKAAPVVPVDPGARITQVWVTLRDAHSYLRLDVPATH